MIAAGTVAKPTAAMPVWRSSLLRADMEQLPELPLLVILRSLDARSLAAVGAVSTTLRRGVLRLAEAAVRQHVSLAGLPVPVPSPLRCDPALYLLLVEGTSSWLLSKAGAEAGLAAELRDLLFECADSRSVTFALRWPWRGAGSRGGPWDALAEQPPGPCTGLDRVPGALRASLRHHPPLRVLLALLAGAVTLHAPAEAKCAPSAAPPQCAAAGGGTVPGSSSATDTSLLLAAAEALRCVVSAEVDARNASISEMLRPGISALHKAAGYPLSVAAGWVAPHALQAPRGTRDGVTGGAAGPTAATDPPALTRPHGLADPTALAGHSRAGTAEAIGGQDDDVGGTGSGVAAALLESGVLPPLLRAAVALAAAEEPPAAAPTPAVLGTPGGPSPADQTSRILLQLAGVLDDAHAALGVLGTGGRLGHPAVPPVQVVQLVAAGGLVPSRMAQPTDGSLLAHVSPLIGHVAAAGDGRHAAALLGQAGGSALPLLLLGLRSKGILPKTHSAAALALLCQASPDRVAAAIALADERAHRLDASGAEEPAAAIGWRMVGAGVCGAAAALLSLLKLIEPPCNERCSLTLSRPALPLTRELPASALADPTRPPCTTPPPLTHRCALRASQCLEVLLPRLLPRARLGGEMIGAAALLQLLRCVAPAGLCASARAAAGRALACLAPVLSDCAVRLAAAKGAFEPLILALAHTPPPRPPGLFPPAAVPLDWFLVSAVAAAADACSALCDRPAGAEAVLAAGGAPALIALLARRPAAWDSARPAAAAAIAALAAHPEGARALVHAGAPLAIDSVETEAEASSDALRLRVALHAARARLAGRTDGAWHDIHDGIC